MPMPIRLSFEFQTDRLPTSDSAQSRDSATFAFKAESH